MILFYDALNFSENIISVIKRNYLTNAKFTAILIIIYIVLYAFLLKVIYY